MYSFPILIKKIREEAGLTQVQFAKAVKVSPVLIAMVESGQKEVSKKLILKLAKLLDVHPSSISPFIFINEKYDDKNFSHMERSFINWGEKIQKVLIKNRAKLLMKYAKHTIP